MLQANNAIELLEKIGIEDLYPKLIAQLNKDFQLAHVDAHFELSLSPDELQQKVATILEHLICNAYDSYLNLIYRIDVSEKDLLQIRDKNLQKSIEQLTFIVLKRECQKVWFKSRF